VQSASAERRPVSLEAGIGPENPPCPACGEPLFGWATAPGDPGLAVRRCESCGLGAVGEPGDAVEALRDLDRLASGEGTYRIANRSSFQASLGGDGWAWLEPGVRYLFTPEAVQRLVTDRGQEVERTRWIAGPSLLGMWGTLLNGFTLGRNIALAVVGRATATPAGKRWQRGLDRFISIAVSLPALVVAVPMELAAALLRRGGVLEIRIAAAA
jgi:hypothetical protein